jgi:hypothetical protein
MSDAKSLISVDLERIVPGFAALNPGYDDRFRRFAIQGLFIGDSA